MIQEAIRYLAMVVKLYIDVLLKEALLSAFLSFPLVLMGKAFMFPSLEQRSYLKEELKPDLSVREGRISGRKQRIKIKKNGKTVAVINLSKPELVAQTDREEKWGFFQFPNIGKSKDGTLVVSWHMREDSHNAYGKPGRQYTPMMSKDNGKTWRPQDKTYFAPSPGYNGLLKDGSLLQVNTPSSKNIRSYESFPSPVAEDGNRLFFNVEQLPEDLQGIYLTRRGERIKTQSFHARLNDPGLIRISIGNLMPVVWWGNIKQLADQSLIAGVYPAVYQDSLGQILHSSVSFYRSVDEGHSWNITGKIPFKYDGIADVRGEKEYVEPTFEILADSSLICIMRTGNVSPMYKTFSRDLGKTWTVPEAFTPNGVMPRLLLLKNGVLVLVSGRLGIQIRFSLDGTGSVWTEPIEMIPFMNDDGTFQRDVSCGYASIIEASDDTFYIVYSNFTTKNSEGQTRKTIWFREVTVNRK